MSRVTTFVTKLHGLLNDTNQSHEHIHFVNKTDFEVSSVDKLAIRGLSPLFQFRSLSSFIRQLSYYGFVRLSDRRKAKIEGEPEEQFIIFTHPTGAFRKDDATELHQIIRKVRSKIGEISSQRAVRSKSTRTKFKSKLKSQKRQRYANSTSEEEGESEYGESHDFSNVDIPTRQKFKFAKPVETETESEVEPDQEFIEGRIPSQETVDYISRSVTSFEPLQPHPSSQTSHSYSIPSTFSNFSINHDRLINQRIRPLQFPPQVNTLYNQTSSQQQYYYPSRIFIEQVHSRTKPNFTLPHPITSTDFITSSPGSSEGSYSPPYKSPKFYRSSPPFSDEDEEEDGSLSGTSDVEKVKRVGGGGAKGLKSILLQKDLRAHLLASSRFNFNDASTV